MHTLLPVGNTTSLDARGSNKISYGFGLSPGLTGGLARFVARLLRRGRGAAGCKER